MNPSLPMSRTKKAVFGVFLAFCCFLFLEAVLIFFEPWLFQGFYQYDPDLGFKVRPYTLGSNRFGFNDRDYPLEKEPGTFRIVFVSDSFSWVGGLDGNYTALLEKQFEARYGAHRVDIINTGYSMTWAREQLEMLRKYGMQYRPDMVVLGFFAGNDFYDADVTRKRIVVNDTYFDINTNREIRVLGRPILFRSRLWFFARQKFITGWTLLKARLEHRDAPPQGGPPPMRGLFPSKTNLDYERERMEFCNVRKYRAGEQEEKIRAVTVSIAGMQSLLQSNGIKFAVAMYPGAISVDPKLQEEVMATHPLDPADYDLALAQKVLKSFLDAANIPSVDLLDEFRLEEQKGDLYRPNDTHWSEAGNALAAELLYRWLAPKVDAAL